MLEGTLRNTTWRTAVFFALLLALSLVLLVRLFSSQDRLQPDMPPKDSIERPTPPVNLSASLFPITPFLSGWSTAPPFPDAPPSVSFLPLSDEALHSTKIAHSALRHTLVDAPPGLLDSAKAFRSFYPKGSINPSGKVKGGFSFYAPGPDEDGLLAAKEVVFAYAVYFEEGFEFNKGGKLPGLYGGTSPDLAYGCSGGRQDDRDSCFSMRLMWRKSGAGELYAYVPSSPANRVLCKVPPKSVCNEKFGYSVARGSWSFEAGKWTTVAQRIRLNDAGQDNGEMAIFVNGVQVWSVSGLVIRKSADCVFRGAHMQTFFGGSGSEWASPRDQSAYFAAFSASIIA